MPRRDEIALRFAPIAALALTLVAGCGDSRTGGPDGMPAPGTTTKLAASPSAADPAPAKPNAGPTSK